MTPRKFTPGRSKAKQATIGFLGATTPSIWSAFVAAFEQRLRKLGWIEGTHIAIDYRWAEGQRRRYAKLAKRFVDGKVDVIVTSGTPAVLAAKSATRKIPIVFASAGDPKRTKLVNGLKRPGGNVTGLSNWQPDLAGRRLDELRKLVPGLKRLGIIGNHDNPVIPLEIAQIKRRAGALKIKTFVWDVQRVAHIGRAFKRGQQDEVDAVFVCSDAFITTHQAAVHEAAVRAR